jgi:hypothetical protein
VGRRTYDQKRLFVIRLSFSVKVSICFLLKNGFFEQFPERSLTLTNGSARKRSRAKVQREGASRRGDSRRNFNYRESSGPIGRVSLVEDGFAMAATAEMRVKLRICLDGNVANLAVLGASSFSREAGFVATARQVLVVDDGRAAVNFADTAVLAVALNRRARTTVMVLAEKAVANGN